MSSAADASDDQQSAQVRLIERQMPVWEDRILLAQPVDAPTHLAYAAIRRVDFVGSRFITMPHRAREVLETLLRSRHEVRQGQPKHFRFDQLLEEARRAFHRYWFAVGPFVRAMGRPVLRLIRTEAEQTRTTASSTN